MKRLFFSLCASAVGCALALQSSATAIAKSKETVLHSFGSGADGEHPFVSLTDVKGTLYGTTSGGGTYGFGTVFSLDPKTRAETVLHSFGSGTDGKDTTASLIDLKGKLYGTTSGGGTYGFGTAFSLDPKTGAETVLYSFTGGTDGAYTYASLINVKGTLYGTTQGGGASGYGTVFSLDPKTGAETVLYSFGSGTDGEDPYASLTDAKGTLYGTTEYGGTSGYGTVFSLDSKTGAETVLYSFTGGTDGEYPYASLIDVKGNLYGTTEFGGSTACSSGCGTVFSLDSKTGAETVLYSFGSGTGGWHPFASLIDLKGTLYGTTTWGGTSGYGTLFSIKKP